MRNKQLTREDVLSTLEMQLDDGVLLNLFPNSHPADIRALLSGKQVKPRQESKPAKEATPSPCSNSDKGMTDLCRLFTDGASRGNPGEAGAGAVVLDKNGGELATHSSYLGRCTNNVAEYKALLLGLEQAKSVGCNHVAIHLDSELIVRQIQGRYRVKNAALKPLYADVVKRLGNFATWTVTHVPRAKNARADELANMGIDRKDG